MAVALGIIMVLGCPRLLGIYVTGEMLQENLIDEVEGRREGSMDGFGQQAWKDSLRLRSEGQRLHEMNNMNNVDTFTGILADLPLGNAVSLCQ